MSQRFDKLVTLLRELFQLDQPELDFGIYRILHAKSAEVTRFLEEDLLPQVTEALEAHQSTDRKALQQELADALEMARSLGADPENVPKVRELRARLKEVSADVDALEAQVFDHLYGFFRRYYSEGDFLSKRVYKPGVYAIPYEGEEVKLHWANADQYYIKTSEYLRDYAFRLRPGEATDPMRVHFRLRDAAEGEHGNVKEAESKGRAFVLVAEDFIQEEEGVEGRELVLWFEYRPATSADWPDEDGEGKSKPPKQKELLDLAESRILAERDPALAPWLKELARPHLKSDGEAADYSRLRAHLDRYAARNTFDYFIHKDLGGFLRRELDFYIKNEVMHLDDIEDETAPRVEQYLSKIKVIRRIAGKIIDFLSQIEDFQKKLWLKKKFVVGTSWCIRMGCIPPPFHPEIVANEAQVEEWKELFSIHEIEGDLVKAGYSEPLPAAFLEAHPSLVLDTRHFGAEFTARLLEALGDLDEQTDAVLFHSENFQALSLMERRLKGEIQCVLLDPPYNTGDDGFAFKDHYPHSSWISMMLDRLDKGRTLVSRHGVVLVHIDDNEAVNLWLLLNEAFKRENYISSMVWKRRSASGLSSQPLSLDHEYIMVFARNLPSARLKGLVPEESQYPFFDERRGLRYASTDLTIGATREERPNQFYPIVNPRSGVSYPANPNRVWRFFPETMQGAIADDLILWPDEVGGTLERPRFKTYFDPEDPKEKPCSSWIEAARGDASGEMREDTEHALEVLSSGMNQEGARVVARLFSKRAFAYPKPVSLEMALTRMAGGTEGSTLDYFAGSGTTGHAVINLNREDGGRRNFILVEMGDYFDTVLLPRLKKVTFTPEWKDGKPKRLATAEEAERSPRVMRVVRLESYEDTLNNLELRRTEEQQRALDLPQAQGDDGFREEYLLRYMLDVETRGSASLLRLAAFTDPAAYLLRVKRPGSDETREVGVDLLETFNWLIGLRVERMEAPRRFAAAFRRDDDPDLPEDAPRRLLLDGPLQEDPSGDWWFRVVRGTLPDGHQALAVWRNRPGGETPEGLERDNLVLNEWFKARGFTGPGPGFDLVYVNGDNNLENLKDPSDIWSARLIEAEFHALMFDGTSL